MLFAVGGWFLKLAISSPVSAFTDADYCGILSCCDVAEGLSFLFSVSESGEGLTLGVLFLHSVGVQNFNGIYDICIWNVVT